MKLKRRMMGLSATNTGGATTWLLYTVLKRVEVLFQYPEWSYIGPPPSWKLRSRGRVVRRFEYNVAFTFLQETCPEKRLRRTREQDLYQNIRISGAWWSASSLMGLKITNC